MFFGLCFSEFAVLVVKIEASAVVEGDTLCGHDGASLSASLGESLDEVSKASRVGCIFLSSRQVSRFRTWQTSLHYFLR